MHDKETIIKVPRIAALLPPKSLPPDPVNKTHMRAVILGGGKKTNKTTTQKPGTGSKLNLLVLHHVHHDPVSGVDVLSDEVFEHDECFH